MSDLTSDQPGGGQSSDRYPEFTQLLATPLPTALYHYTSPDSFLKIIESGVLRASQIQYLNDTKELELAHDLIREELKVRRNCRSIDPWIADGLDLAIDSSPWINIYVCSVSAAIDLLSQWRAYGSVAVDFGPQNLARMAAADPGNLRLLPVVYDSDDQRTLVGEIVDYCAAYQSSTRCADPKNPPPKPSGPFGSISAIDAMALAAPLLKHEGFAEEEEWRLIYFPIGPPPHRVARVRARGDRFVPFVELPLGVGDSKPVVSHVLLGPTASSEANKIAVSRALETCPCEMSGGIDLSDTPFRS